MGKINLGRINRKNEYIKEVSFSKAVLWHTRELSLNPMVLERLIKKKVKILKFIDKKKNEVWQFNMNEILKNGELKQYGQEKQHYFSISYAKRYPLIKKEKVETISPMSAIIGMPDVYRNKIRALFRK